MKIYTVALSLFMFLSCSNLQAETKAVVIPVEISHGAIEALAPQEAPEVQIEVTEEDVEDSKEIAAN